MAIQVGVVSAEITADTRSFDRSVRRVRRKGSRLSNTLQDQFSSIGQSMQRLGIQATQFVSLPIAAAFGGAVFAAGNFEQAMVEVQKVTNETTADRLSESIKEMSEVIPIARTELAGIAADAARFGVRGVENIEAFSTAVAKMSVATDLSAQEAGEALARIGELTGVPAQEIENLGSAINELSNNFATSSSEIVDSMLRAGAAANQFGLSAQELTGLSAALNAVSESSQRAGSRLRRLFQQLLNPDKIGEVAAAIGLTTEEFQRLADNSPREAIMRLIEAMAAGGRQADQLRSTLTTTSRQALAGLAQNIDGVTRALNMAGPAYAKNISLQKEFIAASDTLFAKFTTLWNSIKNLAGGFGQTLIPIVERAISTIRDITTTMQNWSAQTQRTVAVIAGLLGASGPIILAIGTLTAALGAISWPVVLGVAAFTGAVTAISTNWDDLVSYFTSGEGSQIWDTVQRSAADLWDSLKRLFVAGKQALITAWDLFGDDIKETAEWMLETIPGIISDMLDTITFTLQVFSGEWKRAWDTLMADTVQRTKTASQRIRDFLDFSDLPLANFLDFFTPDAGAIDTSQIDMFEWSDLWAPEAPDMPTIPAPVPNFDPIQEELDLLDVDYGDTFTFDKVEDNARNTGKIIKNAFLGAENPINRAAGSVATLGAKLEIAAPKLQRASSKFKTVQAAMQGTQQKATLLGQALQTTVTNAVTSFATTLGNAFTGDAGASGFFNNILLIVTEFANRFGKLLIGAGTAALAFESLLANPIAAIAAGTALVAATAAVRNLLQEGPSQSVNDALITSSGKVIEFHPDDNILAMKDFGDLSPRGNNQVGQQSMQKAFERALKNTVTEVSPSRVFELSQKGKTGF